MSRFNGSLCISEQERLRARVGRKVNFARVWQNSVTGKSPGKCSCKDIPVARQIMWCCPDSEFLVIFCVLHFQRAACITFQSQLDPHSKFAVGPQCHHTMCRSMVDIQSATAEIRRWKKKEERNHRTKIWPALYYIGRPYNNFHFGLLKSALLGKPASRVDHGNGLHKISLGWATVQFYLNLIF